MGNRGLIIRPEQFTLNTLHPLAQGLVLAGLGRFPGSTHYQDSSLYGNHGSITGAPTLPGNWRFIADLNRWAYYTTRDNDSIVVPYNPSLYDANAMAVACWLKPDDTNFSGGAGYILSQWDFAANKRMWTVGLTAASPARFNAGASTDGTAGAGKSTFVNTTVPLTTGWQHLAVNIRGRRYYDFYINGIFRETLDLTTFVFVDQGAVFHTALIDGLANRGPKAEMADILWRVGSLFSPAEINQLANPSNVMLSGLIEAPRRKLFVVPGVVSGPTTYPVTGESFCWAVPSGVITASRVANGNAFVHAVPEGEIVATRAVQGDSFAWAVPEGAITAKRVVSGDAYLWAVANGDISVVGGPATYPVSGTAYAWAVPEGLITAQLQVDGEGFVWAVGSGETLSTLKYDIRYRFNPFSGTLDVVVIPR